MTAISYITANWSIEWYYMYCLPYDICLGSCAVVIKLSYLLKLALHLQISSNFPWCMPWTASFPQFRPPSSMARMSSILRSDAFAEVPASGLAWVSIVFEADPACNSKATCSAAHTACSWLAVRCQVPTLYVNRNTVQSQQNGRSPRHSSDLYLDAACQFTI